MAQRKRQQEIEETRRRQLEEGSVFLKAIANCLPEIEKKRQQEAEAALRRQQELETKRRREELYVPNRIYCCVRVCT